MIFVVELKLSRKAFGCLKIGLLKLYRGVGSKPLLMKKFLFKKKHFAFFSCFGEGTDPLLLTSLYRFGYGTNFYYTIYN